MLDFLKCGIYQRFVIDLQFLKELAHPSETTTPQLLKNMYTHGWFMPLYGKNHYNIKVISLQLK